MSNSLNNKFKPSALNADKVMSSDIINSFSGIGIVFGVQLKLPHVNVAVKTATNDNLNTEFLIGTSLAR
jgi:hypothetical protein